MPGKLTLLASANGQDGSVKIHHDVMLCLGKCAGADTLAYKIANDRQLWLQLFEGELSLENDRLYAGDGVAISEKTLLQIEAKTESKFLLFNLLLSPLEMSGIKNIDSI